VTNVGVAVGAVQGRNGRTRRAAEPDWMRGLVRSASGEKRRSEVGPAAESGD
jgi:hypothetical protein